MKVVGTQGRPGAALLALPDAQEVGVHLNARGAPEIVWRNRFRPPEATLDWLDPRVWTAWWPRAAGLPVPPRPDWAVNFLADADDYAAGLTAHDDWLGLSVPVFNHPRAIAQTRRDLSARRLAGVPGLIVPQCVRFLADSRAAFEAAFDGHDFRFPVLIRPIGEQGGKGQIRVDGPADWDVATDSPWFGRPHFMTQFEETATTGGLYLKARVLFVGDRAFVRHVRAGTLWQVHLHGQGHVQGHDEAAVLERLAADPVFAGLCRGIAERTALDFSGLDIGVDPARHRYVLFECNPAMSVFYRDRPGEAQATQDRRARLQRPAAEALHALMCDPSRWAAAQGGLDGLPRVREALSNTAGH